MPIIALTNPSPVSRPLNWSFVGGGNGSARALAGFTGTLNFYDPVFIGQIASNGALDPTTNTTADITFSPSVNMAGLLDQTAIVPSATTDNDYGYIPYIVEVSGYPPLIINMNDTITANTTKVVVRATGNGVNASGKVTRNLNQNELAGRECYVRRVLCLYELTTRPAGVILDNSTFVGNNNVASADTLTLLSSGTLSSFFLRGDGTTWRASGGTTNRGNVPLLHFLYSNTLNPVRLSVSKVIRYP